ncbi:P-type conjugative transfer protein TrbG [Phenylobacterium sp. LjRoot225]|uniref:P-type conjugative transfer protein TrbG n=1 Tax=Phenylobacterium sp. LjRoot225 TaxID=3342285 RepID=UPI003ECF61AA
MSRRALVLLSSLSLAGCVSHGPPAPQISLDAISIPARVTSEPPRPMQVVAIPQPLPLPGQLKPLSPPPASQPVADPKRRVLQASAEARVQPARDGFINAVQVWPFSPGALYQLYASPGRVTDIALQPGEKLTSVSAGDTLRWVIGDTTSGAGATSQVHVLVKPTLANLKTNLLIYTDHRLYQLEMTASPSAWMASLAWSYPQDELTALRAQNAAAEAEAPIASGVQLERLQFRYAISGDKPAWRPVNAFDDGEKVYIQFPAGIAQAELPPLFVVGGAGEAQLVNYRVQAPYYVVDGLFGAAELRLGGKRQAIVRIERTDGRRAGGLFR